MYTSEVEAADALKNKYQELKTEIGKVIVGQEKVVEEVLIAIFSGGHVLLVGVPGLAKTLLVNTISKALGLDFSRIQFTPDLMPSDILGSEILNEQRKFEFIPGPLFAQVVLADEINRTPPKTQSALLEAMQEKSVTVAGKTRPLGQPFFVLATQNPIEQEGTYPLPEAQLDRFMFNIWLDYPTYEDELEVVQRTTTDKSIEVAPQMQAKDILYFQNLVRSVPVAKAVVEYAVGLVAKTRPNKEKSADIVNQFIAWGAGPRASQNLILAAKCHALFHGKYTPDMDDVKAVAHAVLRHRLVTNYKADAEGLSVDDIIARIL